MTAPTTAAGQTFDTEWPGSHIDRLGWQKRILAIEAEARAAGADAERDRMFEKAALFRSKFHMTDSEYGAVMAVLMIGDVTPADIEWGKEIAAILDAPAGEP